MPVSLPRRIMNARLILLCAICCHADSVTADCWDSGLLNSRQVTNVLQVLADAGILDTATSLTIARDALEQISVTPPIAPPARPPSLPSILPPPLLPPPTSPPPPLQPVDDPALPPAQPPNLPPQPPPPSPQQPPQPPPPSPQQPPNPPPQRPPLTPQQPPNLPPRRPPHSPHLPPIPLTPAPSTGNLDCSSHVHLDFTRACSTGYPAQNNLGGQGPDVGEEVLRFSSVGELDGRSIDLVVQTTGSLSRYIDDSADGGYSGCYGLMGMVTIQAGTQVHLRFSFEDSLDHRPVTLPSFDLAILDLDGLGSEQVAVSNFSNAIFSEPTNVVEIPPSAFTSCSQNCPYDNAAAPNPTNPSSLTEEQQAASVALTFARPVSAFTVTWGNPTYYDFNPKPWSQRMFFAGESSLTNICPKPPAPPQTPNRSPSPSTPPPKYCSLFAGRTDLRSGPAPEWCNSDPARRTNPNLCARFYVTDDSGRVGLCEHEPQTNRCLMQPTARCEWLPPAPPLPDQPAPITPPPAFPSGPPFFPPSSPETAASNTPYITSTLLDDSSPFIATIGVSGLNSSVLTSINVTIQPRPGASAATVTATYTKAYLLAKGWLDESTQTASVNVFGLYANYTNIVELDVVSSVGNRHHRLLAALTTRSWTGALNEAERIDVVPRNGAVSLAFSFMLLKHQRTPVGPIIMDVDGYVRWVSSKLNFNPQSVFMWDNALYFGNISALMRVELDSTVTKVADYNHLGATFHHNIDRGRDGMLLEMDIDFNGTVQIESTVYEVGWAGELLRTWDLSSIVREAMRAGGDDPSLFVIDGVDWCHQNAGTFWAQSAGALADTLVVSCREQFVIGVGYDDHQIKWILGDPGKAWHVYPSLRAFELTLSAGSLPPIGQHTTSVTGAGELMLFDNGFASLNTHFSLPTGENRNYSAARKYVIDEVARTATEVWTYDHGREVYSRICSSAYERDGSAFVMYSNEGGLTPLTSDADVRYLRLLGLDASDAVGFEFKYRRYDQFCGASWHGEPIDFSELVFAPTRALPPPSHSAASPPSPPRSSNVASPPSLPAVISPPPPGDNSTCISSLRNDLYPRVCEDVVIEESCSLSYTSADIDYSNPGPRLMRCRWISDFSICRGFVSLRCSVDPLLVPLPPPPTPPSHPPPPPPSPSPNPPPLPDPPPLPPPTSCALSIDLVDLRGINPPEWCNEDPARKVSKELCEQFFVTGRYGQVGLCKHDAASNSCLMETPTHICSPPPLPPPLQPPPSPPASPHIASSTLDDRSPFIATIVLGGLNSSELTSINVTIQPRPGASAAPLTATYTKAYLLAKGWLDESTQTASVNVFGLYANYTNIVELDVVSSVGNRHHRLLAALTTRAWTGALNEAERIDAVPRKGAVSLAFSYMLMKHRRTPVGPIIMDVDGYVRWVSSNFNFRTQLWTLPALLLDNALYFGNISVLMRLELDSTVTKVADYSHLGATFHHNIDRGRDGMLLEMDVNLNGTRKIGATLIEVDVRGTLLQTWDLSSIVREAMRAGGDDPSLFVVDGVDWCHVNAGTFWAQSAGALADTLVVSCREQFVIGVGYDDHQIKWILGDPGKAWHVYPSLRAFELTLSAGSLPPIGQHSTSVTGAGELMLFDNGFASRNTHFSLPTGESRNYSAARKYVIDEVARTATEVWTYDHGRTIYSPVCSSAYQHGDSSLILFSNEGGNSVIVGDDKRYTRMVGVRNENEVGFEYAWRKYDRFCGDSWLSRPIELSHFQFTN